jgi:DNA polymerase-3 subunit delta'
MPLRQIIGHQGVVDLLLQAVARKRVPQSLVFAGPDGIGKRTTAVALAQAINCPAPREGDACGACPVCTRIGKGTFQDVVLLQKGDEASIRITPLRERVLDVVGYRPFEGARRLFIIEPADDLTVQAQDALLKTLEEPPSTSILILVTAYPDTLLPTIQSRCRRVRFGALDEDEVVRILVERLGHSREDAATRASASGGSVARALAADVRTFAADRDAALGMLAAARSGSVADRLKAGEKFAKIEGKRRAREASVTRLAILASLLRDLATIGAGRPVPLANADLRDNLQAFAPVFDMARLTEAFAAVDHAGTAVERNASAKIVADWLAVRL